MLARFVTRMAAPLAADMNIQEKQATERTTFPYE